MRFERANQLFVITVLLSLLVACDIVSAFSMFMLARRGESCGDGKGPVTGSGRGFGSRSKQSVTSSSPAATKLIKRTRVTQFRSVQGAFAKTLKRYTDNFNQLKFELDSEKEVVDIYARLKYTETFWFTGKVAYLKRGGMDLVSACASIEDLLREYAKALRPRELAGPQAVNKELQLWYAPGNSELQIAQNKQSLTRLELGLANHATAGSRPSNCDCHDIRANIRVVANEKSKSGSENVEDEVNITVGIADEIEPKEEQPSLPCKDLPAIEMLIGYEPEIYLDKEEGFRCLRDNEGNAIAPQFEVQIADPSEMDRLKQQQ